MSLLIVTVTVATATQHTTDHEAANERGAQSDQWPLLDLLLEIQVFLHSLDCVIHCIHYLFPYLVNRFFRLVAEIVSCALELRLQLIDFTCCVFPVAVYFFTELI